MLVHEKKIIVTRESLDKNNHVNNTQYVRWVQMMADEHWDKLKGQTPYETKVWFLIDHHIQYKKQAFLGDELLLRTFPQEPVGIRQPRIVEFYKNNELIVASETLWVLMDSETHKMVKLASDWLEKLRS